MNPFSAASLNLTQACNLNCSYCFNGNKNNKKMSYETAVKCIDFILKEVAEANVNQLNGKMRRAEIQFWGGEPLLEWDMIKRLVDYSENTKYKDVIVTFNSTSNGTLLTEDKFEFMQDHQLFFMISLDGTPETHNRYRKFHDGKGSQEIIMKNVKKALERWPLLNVRMSPYPERIDHFFEDVKYLVENGITNIMWSPVYEADWTDDAWDTWEEQLYGAVNYMIQMGKQKGTSFNFKEFNRDDQYDKYDKYACGAARHYIGFDANGAIYICHRFAKFEDTRPWQEQEGCIGHVDVGITKPEIREKLINFPEKRGCPAVNFDLCGDTAKVHEKVRMYESMMRRVRKYNKRNIKMTSPQQIMNVQAMQEERIKKIENKLF
jgi:uncharacterized protein